MLRAFKSIRVQILAIVLVCYLTPTLLLGQYMGSVFFEDLRKKTEAALTSGVEHARALTVQNIEQLVTLAKDATYDGELTSAYTQYSLGNIADAEFLRLSRTYIERKYGREPELTFSAYFTLERPELLIYNRASYAPAQRFQETAQAAALALGSELDTKCLFWEGGGNVCLVRNLMNLKMQRFGMLVLGVDMNLVLAPLSDLAAAWDAQMDVKLGQAGATQLNWDALPSGLWEPEDSEHLIYTLKDEARDWELAVRLSISKERIYGEMWAFRRLMAGLLMLLVPIMAIMLWYVRRRIVKPITLLANASKRIEAGELGVTVPMHGDDELGNLGQAFSRMSTRIAELIDKTYKEEIALRDARIQAMQSRINPHFINNALESINWQARMEGCEKVSAMVEALSVLLNASMAKANRRMVLLREEVEVAEAYLYFVSQRFGDRLCVTCDIPSEALGFTVPLLSIQPLLENAIEHGIAPAGGGELGLLCRLDDERLTVEVTNSGQRISPEDEKRIALSLAGDNQGGIHLGLANISSRLRLIYEGAAGLTVSSGERGLTVARLTLPARHPSAQADTTEHI